VTAWAPRVPGRRAAERVCKPRLLGTSMGGLRAEARHAGGLRVTDRLAKGVQVKATRVARLANECGYLTGIFIKRAGIGGSKTTALQSLSTRYSVIRGFGQA
jgi:hypothetical protein